MEFQMVVLPLICGEMTVEAYLFRYLKNGDLFEGWRASGAFPPDAPFAPLEMIDKTGLDAFAMSKPAFLPIRADVLLDQPQQGWPKPAERVIFLLEGRADLSPPYLAKMAQLRAEGYRFALQNPDSIGECGGTLRLCDWVFLSGQPQDNERTREVFRDLRVLYPDIRLVAEKIETRGDFDRIDRADYALFEVHFPLAPGGDSLLPQRAGAAGFLRVTLAANYDREQIAQTIKRDPALTASLLRMVSAPRLGARVKIKTVEHALFLLGQWEVRKWAVAATAALDSNPPGEVARTALLRAKFAENLAPLFDLDHQAEELFLLGFCASLDLLYDLPLERAIKLVMPSDQVVQALCENSGPFHPICALISSYLRADWPTVARQVILDDLSETGLRAAYLDALAWSSGLVLQAEHREAASPAHL
ncbi:MAG: HDOD domain-containing protein [Oscillospiraceae bacterium]|nr:HDOD domain-containing protein [Oscillospiraceae bacterium]